MTLTNMDAMSVSGLSFVELVGRIAFFMLSERTCRVETWGSIPQ